VNESEFRWHCYFIEGANWVSTKSKDRSTKVGAMIVGPDMEGLTSGYNGFPRGIDDAVDARHERPAKYRWTEHAERNAIYHAARHGVRIHGCTLYLNYSPAPGICTDCARAIIQAGIRRVVGPTTAFPGVGNWTEDFLIANEMFEEVGIEVIRIDMEPGQLARVGT